jgi:type VI secretion system protein ImpE
MTKMREPIADCLQLADVGGALRESAERIRSHPQDKNARLKHIDLLIIDGAFASADKQAVVLATLDPKLAVSLTLLRGRLRAEDARAAWFEDHAPPSFPEGPTERDKTMMALHLELSDGDDDALREKAERARANSTCGPIAVNGKMVDVFRDIDDRIPHALEALCADGSYMWLDFALLHRIDFRPVERVRDLVWRQARVTMRCGSASDLTIPATYFALGGVGAMKLARETDWRPLRGGLFAGAGQKCFLAGEESIGILAVETIEFS